MASVLSREEADEVCNAMLQVLGTLALLYKLDGVSSEAHPKPIRVPFANNVNEAYESFTPRVRELMVKALYGQDVL